MSTQTLGLSTVFTPPISCSTHWTYEAQSFNTIQGGLLLQNALAVDIECFPPGFSNVGQLPVAQVYSPGSCPSGYTDAVITLATQTTTVVCCQSDFSYYSTISMVNSSGSGSVEFQGCLSTFPLGSTTTVQARTEDSNLTSTQITGPVTMWGQPITVQYQRADATTVSTTTPGVFPTSTLSIITPQAPSGLTFQPSIDLSTISTSNIPSSTMLVPTISSTTRAGLGPGAKAGIGFGVTAMSLALVSVGGLFLWRRRIEKKAKAKARARKLRRATINPRNNQYKELKRQRLKLPVEMEASESKRASRFQGTTNSPAELGV